jgi:DNA-binding response OmpR family regulator
MIFHALLLLTDEGAAEVLQHVLADYQVESEHCLDLDAAALKLAEQRFDAVVVDVDEPNASDVLARVRRSALSKNAITISLVSDPSLVRPAFGMGANFVLYKPVSPEPVRSSLLAVIALLKRERRRSFRVPVQLPVTLSWQGVPEVEGIMLDLSENGMDVLSAQALQQSLAVQVHFSLPDLSQIAAMGEVAWANSNGQAGVEFIDFPEGQRRMVQNWLAANAQDYPPSEAEPLSCKLSDLSIGGCYLETPSPFPLHAELELSLRASDAELKITALVRVMHPGYGMGLEFISDQGEHRHLIAQFISLLSANPGSAPQVSAAPKSIHFHSVAKATEQEAEVEDKLVELLRSDTPRTQDEFLAELHQQRNSSAQAAGV